MSSTKESSKKKVTVKPIKVLLTPKQGKIVFEVEHSFEPGLHDVVVDCLAVLPKTYSSDRDRPIVHVSYVPNSSSVMDFTCNCTKDPVEVDLNKEQVLARQQTVNSDSDSWLQSMAEKKCQENSSVAEIRAFFDFFREEKRNLLDAAAEINASLEKRSAPKDQQTRISLSFKYFVEKPNQSERILLEYILKDANFSTRHEVRLERAKTGPQVMFHSRAVLTNPSTVDWSGLEFELLEGNDFASTELNAPALPGAEADIVDMRLRMSNVLILQSKDTTKATRQTIKIGTLPTQQTSAKSPSTFVIPLLSLAAPPKYYAISPEIRPTEAFLVCELHNTLSFDIPAGPCDVFCDNAFVTVRPMSATRPDSRIRLDLGPAPDVQVLFHKSAKKDVKNNGSDSTRHQYSIVTRTVVVNSSPVEIPVRLCQQFPKAKDSDGAKKAGLTVQLLSPAVDGKSVVQSTVAPELLWYAQVQPGNEHEMKVEYEICWIESDTIRGSFGGSQFGLPNRAPQFQQQPQHSQQLPQQPLGLFSNNNTQPSPFGFGAPSSAPTSNSAFGAPTSNSAFGGSSFGAPSSSSSFGGSLFGAPTSSSLFGISASNQFGYSAPSSATSGFGFATTQQTNTLSAPSQLQATSIFNTSSQPQTTAFSLAPVQPVASASPPSSGDWVEATDIDEPAPARQSTLTKNKI